jgi:RNA polymerase sigma-70 factor (ECF subfamily)
VSTTTAKLRLIENESSNDPSDRGPLSLADAFRTYSPYIAQIGRRLLGPSDEIEDFVQDVFIQARRGISSVQSPGAFKGWLATIAVRLARRKLRRRQFRQLFWFEREVDYASIAGSDSSPEDAALLARIYRVLEGLPPDLRIAWSLRVLHGERINDVAELCECSPTTVKRRVAAAQTAILEVVEDG